MWSQVVEMLLADPRTNVNLSSQAAGLTVPFPHDIILWTNLTMICFFKQFSAPKYKSNISSFTFFLASAHCLCHWELGSCANDSRQARSHLTQLEVWRMFFQRWPDFVYVEKILILFDNASHIRDRDDGISPLMAAVGAGRLEVVRHLVRFVYKSYNQNDNSNSLQWIIRLPGCAMKQSVEIRNQIDKNSLAWPTIGAYLIFVIFFTVAKFLENKIYTEKRQFFPLNL